MARGDEDGCGQAMVFHWLSQMKVVRNQQGFPEEVLATRTATRQVAVVQRQEPIQSVNSPDKSSTRGSR